MTAGGRSTRSRCSRRSSASTVTSASRASTILRRAAIASARTRSGTRCAPRGGTSPRRTRASRCARHPIRASSSSRSSTTRSAWTTASHTIPPPRARWRATRCAATWPRGRAGRRRTRAAAARISTAAMRDFTPFLWLLKFGALPNLYFLGSTVALATVLPGADARVVIPALIFFTVSIYRCLSPVHYEHYVVFHDSVLSSVFITRLLATFSEVAYIFLLAQVLQKANVDDVGWVNAVAWLMVVQVVVCQVCVWVAILTERFQFYFYEELGWLFMYGANGIVSAVLYQPQASKHGLLILNVVFGVLYAPFQIVNLWKVRAQARAQGDTAAPWTIERLATGLRRSIRVRNRRTDAASWGGVVGAIWMAGYWATLLPLWVYAIVLSAVH